MHVAVENGLINVVKLLLAKEGIDKNILDEIIILLKQSFDFHIHDFSDKIMENTFIIDQK